MSSRHSRGLPLLAGAVLALRVVAPGPAAAQERPQPVFSVGQPPQWQPYTTAQALITRDEPGGAALVAGIARPLLNPVSGLLSLAAEGYGAPAGQFAGGGARVIARVPVFGVGVGADWNLGRGGLGRVDALLTFQTAVRRGGLLGHGSTLRLDWLPTRGRTVGIGVSFPLLQPLAGRTRPNGTDVRMPRGAVRGGDAGLPPAALEALTAMDRAASVLRAGSSLDDEADVQLLVASAASGNAAWDAALREYHRGLARAFAAAAGAGLPAARVTPRARPDSLARVARAVLLDEVLIPFDSLFGRVKSGGISGLTARAQQRFAAWVRDSAGVAPAAQPAVLAVHERSLQVVERIHRELRARRGDSRPVWLPITLALEPEEFDEQAEVDSLLARLAGRPFTDGNALSYLRSADLPLEIARSIYAARDYHVLWMHDFTGRREKTGTVDNLAYEMVADAYFPALTAAVRQYDATGRLPAYMIFLDQYFYEPRRGRLWMTILEDPMHAAVALPGDNAPREAHLRERQRELRDAVAASRRLQAEARGDGDWIRRRVKVHVNITFPADFSFRSHHIIPGIPFTPDNVMRDHRKIVLYDVTEADPYRGAMFLMGIGIGEHYASATWEDRGYRLRGPATLEARDALRRLLRRHGFDDADLPPPLRAVVSTAAAERRASHEAFEGRALQVHNEVGFGAKHASVARAALYDLAQPGSVVIVPDPLWLSHEWAAMLAGAAARGARVHVIAPAVPNAPSPQAPLMALAHDVMLQLVERAHELAPVMRASGGELRVGLFTATAPVTDAAGRRREVQEGLARAPWLRELFPFDAQTKAVLDRAEALVATDGSDATDLARDQRPREPQLHQKTQLIARPGAIAAALRVPGWDAVLASARATQSRQTTRFADQLGYVEPALDTAATRQADAILRAFEQSLPAAERQRVSFYFTVGTQNEDPRGLMSDGEATVVTSGFQGITGLVDLYYLMARSTWVTTRRELEAHLPRGSALARLLARLARPVL
jgi:phosphatidylserine/phosphatidylglycerophosphate/cardiolipin synthase-like enzyme